MQPAESVSAVLEDLAGFLNDATAASGFAALGLQRFAEFLEQLPTLQENPDPRISLGIGDPNDPSAQAYASWRRSEALRQTAKHGPVEARLGQQWLVYVYTAWEHDFRRRLAKAHGCSEGALRFPLLGDLRLLRNDVIHHHGIATLRNTGSCQTVGHWFREGDPIILRGEHYAEFMRLFPWPDLASKP